MPRINPIERADADPKAAELFQGVKKALGVTPNMMTTKGRRGRSDPDDRARRRLIAASSLHQIDSEAPLSRPPAARTPRAAVHDPLIPGPYTLPRRTKERSPWTHSSSP